MTLVDRFLKYVSFDTQSDESTGLTPQYSKTDGIRRISEDGTGIFGIGRYYIDEHGYLLPRFLPI